MKENKISSADGVRGFALMIVVVGHATGLFFPSIHDQLGGTGQPGVWLFFVLSSFLLTSKLINTGFSFLNVLSYSLGRIIRILPIFYIAAFAYYLMGFYDFNKLKSILIFENTYLHLWTIPIEFKFYFLLPVIVFCALGIYKHVGINSALMFLVFLTVALIAISKYKVTSNSLVLYMPVFIYGVIIAFVHNLYCFKINRWIGDGVSVAIIATFVLLTPPFQGVNGWLADKYVILGVFIATFIYVQANTSGYINKILSSKLMMDLGKYSFSIYLFHIMIIFIIYPKFTNNMTAYVITNILCVGGGVVAYHIIESPLESFRHKLMKRIAHIYSPQKSNNLEIVNIE